MWLLTGNVYVLHIKVQILKKPYRIFIGNFLNEFRMMRS